jgi:hypothetical protein
MGALVLAFPREKKHYPFQPFCLFQAKVLASAFRAGQMPSHGCWLSIKTNKIFVKRQPFSIDCLSNTNKPICDLLVLIRVHCQRAAWEWTGTRASSPVRRKSGARNFQPHAKH